MKVMSGEGRGREEGLPRNRRKGRKRIKSGPRIGSIRTNSEMKNHEESECVKIAVGRISVTTGLC
jgi:hypothetical protein